MSKLASGRLFIGITSVFCWIFVLRLKLAALIYVLSDLVSFEQSFWDHRSFVESEVHS